MSKKIMCQEYRVPWRGEAQTELVIGNGVYLFSSLEGDWGGGLQVSFFPYPLPRESEFCYRECLLVGGHEEDEIRH